MVQFPEDLKITLIIILYLCCSCKFEMTGKSFGFPVNAAGGIAKFPSVLSRPSFDTLTPIHHYTNGEVRENALNFYF